MSHLPWPAWLAMPRSALLAGGSRHRIGMSIWVLMLGGVGGPFLLRRSWRGIRCGFADRKLHGCDFLHLVDDDLLRDAPQLFVLAVAQLADSHRNGALMMRDHHRHEITVDIAGRLDRHIVHHLDHGCLVLLPERSFVDGGSRRRRRVVFLRHHM